MKESALWGSLKKSGELPFAIRIESAVTPGLPDVYFSLTNGVTGWIELKEIPDTQKVILKTGTGKGQLRPLQVLWAKQATEQNIFTTVLLFYRKRAILLSGRDVERLIGAKSEDVLSAAIWTGQEAARQRWDGLREKLDKHGRLHTIQMATQSD